MDLLVFGINHRTAPIEVRERWAFSLAEAREALVGARELVPESESVILSTCNRTEIYCLSQLHPSPGPSPGTRQDPEAARRNLERMLEYFHRLKHFHLEWASPAYYLRRGPEAVEHLFRVASGLDSMIVGEGQILRQLRDSYELARQAGSIGKVFGRLFPAALRAGKRARTETAISRGCITHGQAAVQIAREELGDLRGRQILLLGTGKISRMVAKGIQELGVSKISIVNRTLRTAQELAASLGGEAHPLGNLPCLLEAVDLVISSTGATQPIVARADMEEAAGKRGGRRLLVIDLAVPRDFDISCGEVPGVVLRNIDHLNSIVEENVRLRSGEIPAAEEIVKSEVRAFREQLNWIQLDPVIQHIKERFDLIRKIEIEQHLGSIPEEHRPAVDALTSSLVNKLLNFPIEKLKALRDEAGLDAGEVGFIRKLFLAAGPRAAGEPRPVRPESRAAGQGPARERPPEEVVRLRSGGIPAPEGIVPPETGAHQHSIHRIQLAPVIQLIVERFEVIRETHLEQHLGSIPPEHRPAAEALTSSLLKRLLNFPLEKLKSLPDAAGLDPDEVSFIRKLFLSSGGRDAGGSGPARPERRAAAEGAGKDRPAGGPPAKEPAAAEPESRGRGAAQAR